MSEWKRIALIPAYEPDEKLPPLTLALKEAGLTVVVVDDGSGPNYDAIFDACLPNAQVIRYVPNGGKGHALKTGYRAIAERFPAPYLIVTLDCDGQHTVADTLRICEAAEAEPDTLILGSRKFDKDVPARSQFGNTMTRLVYRLATGLKVRDTQTGLRAFTDRYSDVMQEISGDRYEYEMNVLMYCAVNKIAIHELDIETIYLDNNSGSHFNTFKDSARIYKTIFRFVLKNRSNVLKFAASSFTGFLVDYAAFALFSLITGFMGVYSAPVSNVSARIVSATTNFLINKFWIFKNKDSALKTGAMYFVLAACILGCNTLLISLLVNTLHWNRYVAKLITEVTFFTLSYLAQKYIVFRKKEQ